MEDIPVIKIVNVTQKFGDFTAVNCFNFEIWENQSIGIIGPNGAGKTTALNHKIPPYSYNYVLTN